MKAKQEQSRLGFDWARFVDVSKQNILEYNKHTIAAVFWMHC